MMISSSKFNFKWYYYEVVFEEVNTNFFERLFSRKEKKLRYTIREISKSMTRIYYLNEFGLFASSTPKIFWNNPSDPQDIIIQAKFREMPGSGNVIFSSRDVDTV